MILVWRPLPRLCERSEAIQEGVARDAGLLRYARKDGVTALDPEPAPRYLFRTRRDYQHRLWGKTMKSFVLAVVFAVVAAFGASLVLEGFQRPVDTAYSTGGVRL